MTATIDEDGLQIETLDEITEAIAVELEGAGFRSDLESSFGQLKRIWGEQEALTQEALLAVYNTLSFFAEGANLDRVVALLGVDHRPVQSSRITGEAAGTQSTEIPDGTRIQYNPDETVWAVVDGPYTIGSGGTVTITLEAEDEGEDLEPALDPDTGFDDWTILDSVTGFDTFESQTQEVVGAPVETGTSLRERAATEAYRRGQGPLRSIAAAVTHVEGVEYVNVYENRTLLTDADGLPGKSINVVVDGGSDDDVADAILVSRPAGAELYAEAGAFEVAVVREPLEGHPITIRFNRVDEIDIWIECTLTTSTSESVAPANVYTLVAAILLEKAAEFFGIGDDVLPGRLEHAVWDAELGGIDDVQVTISDDGMAFGSAKIAIGIKDRAAFDAARIDVTEAT